jgi:hypothetical protein
MVVDQNMSVLEGSIGIFPRHDEERLEAARALLEDAGFADEILRRCGRSDERWQEQKVSAPWLQTRRRSIGVER